MKNVLISSFLETSFILELVLNDSNTTTETSVLDIYIIDVSYIRYIFAEYISMLYIEKHFNLNIVVLEENCF